MTSDDASAEAICQECGGEVHIEVSFEPWGVESVLFECRECGRSGRTARPVHGGARIMASHRDSGYPDYVLQAKCMNCREVFYPRMDANACPYCADTDVVTEGNGVVCHNAE